MPTILRQARLGRGRTSTALLFFLVLPGLLILAGPTPGETAGWKPTGSLAQARNNHTATLLPNGQVLVAGGAPYSGELNGPYPLDSAELYNPATGTWSATGPLAITPRTQHTATLLPNGQVLVAGGLSGFRSLLNSAELYDPASGYWDATGSLAVVRYGHTATLLANGRVLVPGGYNASSVLQSAEIYDPASGTWGATGSLLTGRGYYTATLLANGQVLVAGGMNGTNPVSYYNSAELYDPVAGTWSATGALAAGRSQHTATLLPNGKVLVAGGYNGSAALPSAQIYDPGTGTWHTTGALATARYGHTATLLANGQVLVAGGYNSSYIQSTELYDPATGKWSAAGFLTKAHTGGTATRLGNGQVLVAAGQNMSSLANADLYQAAVTKKTLLAPLELLLLGYQYPPIHISLPK